MSILRTNLRPKILKNLDNFAGVFQNLNVLKNGSSPLTFHAGTAESEPPKVYENDALISIESSEMRSLNSNTGLKLQKKNQVKLLQQFL